MSKLAIDDVPIFKCLKPADIRLLKKTLREVSYPENTILIKENERGDSLYIIIEGEVEILKALGTEEEHILAIEGPGQLIGEMSLLNRSSLRSASVRTKTPVVMYEMNHAHFNDLLLKSQTSLATEIMRELSLRLLGANETTMRDLRLYNKKISEAYDQTLEALAKTLELRDHETEGHTRRVTDMTLKLGKALGIKNKDELTFLRQGAMLHDIGKMRIPDGILLKPGRLTEEEWVIMQKHPEYAMEMLSQIEFLAPALDIPYCHHEKWNGNGYPRALKGEQIPFSARLFAVADVWDALVSDRRYRKALPEEEVILYINSLSGTHFDHRVVEIFTQLRHEELNH